MSKPDKSRSKSKSKSPKFSRSKSKSKSRSRSRSPVEPHVVEGDNTDRSELVLSKVEEGQKTITFVGCGQVNAVFIALLVKKNKELKEARKTDKIVKISVLGREGENFEQWKTKGFSVDVKQNKEADIETISVIPDSDLAVISDQVSEIKKSSGIQDYVIMSVKANKDNYKLVESLQDITDENTIITIAQNGVPCSMIVDKYQQKIKETGQNVVNELKPEAGQPKQKGPLSLFRRNNNAQEQETVQEQEDVIASSKSLVDAIGKNRLANAVLNLACSIKFKELEDGRKEPIRGQYSLKTPIKNISVPIDLANDDDLGRRITILKQILNNCGIDTRTNNMDYDIMKKLQINIAINALTALLGVNIGNVVHDREENIKALVQSLCSNVSNISAAINPSESLPTWKGFKERLERSKGHPTSMCVDAELGNPLETLLYDRTVKYAELLNVRCSAIREIAKILCKFDSQIQLHKSNGEQNFVEIARENVKEDLNQLLESVYESYLTVNTPREEQTIKRYRSEGNIGTMGKEAEKKEAEKRERRRTNSDDIGPANRGEGTSLRPIPSGEPLDNSPCPSTSPQPVPNNIDEQDHSQNRGVTL